MEPSFKTTLVLKFSFLMLLSHVQVWSQQDQFTLLDAKHTGITFENTLVDTRELNILIYSNFYGGAGVGIADFDKDGLQDIFLAGNLVGDRLYRNLGELRFDDLTQAAGIVDNGGWSSGVVIADVNNDGWPDIYVCRELYDDNPQLRENKLYINNGASSRQSEFPGFTESAKAYGLADNRRSRHATFLDYNKDGHLDLFVLNQPPNPGNYSDLYGTKPGPKYAPKLYKNNGDQSFSDVTEQAAVGKAGYPNSVTASDLNNDGWVDLYVANDFAEPDFFYLNNGDGTFRDILVDATRHISYFSMGVDAADINNDGWLDVMVLDMVAEDNYRLKANMSGMNPKSFWKVVDDGGHYQYMFNSLQLNQGNFGGAPIFSDIAQQATVSSTDWSWSNLIADFDNDGLKDIHVTNGLLRDIRNTDADKKFSNYVEEVAYKWIDDNPNAGDVSIWDILDLQEALKIVPSQKLANYAFKNNGDLTFSKVTATWGLDQPSFSHGSAYADLDNDGDLDLVVNNVNDQAFVYRNNTSELSNHHYLRVKLTDKSHHKPTLGAKIKISYGKESQWYEYTNVRGMYSTSEMTAHFGLGAADQIDSMQIIWPDGRVTELQNVAADQLLDVDYHQAYIAPSENKLAQKQVFSKADLLLVDHQENDFDDYQRQVLLPHKMSQFGPALASGDINGDGRDDFYVGGASGSSGSLMLQTASGEFSAVGVKDFFTDSNYEDVDAFFLDVESDGDLDLYVVSGGNEWDPDSPNYQDRLYINDGSGAFDGSGLLPEIRESGSCVRPFDFDDDGDLDLFIGGRHVPGDYPAPANSHLLENRAGRFVDVSKNMAKDLKKLGLVTDAVWYDFDQDGLTDLIVVGEWMPITFIRNTGSKFVNVTNKSNLLDTEGWWYSIAANDLDQDGDQDLVVGNLGLNYKYKASPQEPFEVFYDDFDDNGSKDIVLSYYNFGDRFPLRGRSCSAQQVPDIKYDFPTYEKFASANLLQVYGLEDLNQSLHYQAKTFASVWIENLGKGSFEIHELPKQAQISSVNDILIDDYNQDGIKDLLLAGNLYTSEIETPRNDASLGLLLLGSAHKEFIPQAPFNSGLYVPFDVKKMIRVNSDHKSFLIFGVNNGPLQSFQLINGKQGSKL